jgi:tight adherence protein B
MAIVLISMLAAVVVALGAYVIAPLLWNEGESFLNVRVKACAAAFEEMYIHLPRWQVKGFVLLGPIASVAASLAVFRSWWLILLSSVVLSLATRNLYRMVIATLQQQRRNRIKGQLVDALGMVASALRSGLSLQQGFQVVAEEIQPPLSQEFQFIVTSQQLGKTFDQALSEFSRRVPLEEVELLVSSLAILRESGGNVIETLEVIIATIAEEQRVRDKIRTLTTQGIAQAVVISALPLFLGAALYIISPQYIMPLLTHPLGWGMIAFMFFMQGMGMFMMKKIVTIRV